MRGFIFLLIIFFSFSFKFHGSNVAYLTCKSKSGRTIFTAELQDIVGPLQKAELLVDGKKLSFNEEDEAYTIFDEQKSVFTIYIKGKETDSFPNGRFIQFWALPESFRILKSDSGHQIYEFKARIEATERERRRTCVFQELSSIANSCIKSKGILKGQMILF